LLFNKLKISKKHLRKVIINAFILSDFLGKFNAYIEHLEQISRWLVILLFLNNLSKDYLALKYMPEIIYKNNLLYFPRRTLCP